MPDIYGLDEGRIWMYWDLKVGLTFLASAT